MHVDLRVGTAVFGSLHLVALRRARWDFASSSPTRDDRDHRDADYTPSHNDEQQSPSSSVGVILPTTHSMQALNAIATSTPCKPGTLAVGGARATSVHRCDVSRVSPADRAHIRARRSTRRTQARDWHQIRGQRVDARTLRAGATLAGRSRGRRQSVRRSDRDTRARSVGRCTHALARRNARQCSVDESRLSRITTRKESRWK